MLVGYVAVFFAAGTLMTLRRDVRWKRQAEPGTVSEEARLPHSLYGVTAVSDGASSTLNDGDDPRSAEPS